VNKKKKALELMKKEKLCPTKAILQLEQEPKGKKLFRESQMKNLMFKRMKFKNKILHLASTNRMLSAFYVEKLQPKHSKNVTHKRKKIPTAHFTHLFFPTSQVQLKKIKE